MKISTDKVQEFEIRHSKQLRAIAPECMVLLKKNGDFPLEKPCKIALYGNGARQTIKGGTGSGDVNVRHFVTVEEGLENAGFTITTKSWLDSYDLKKESEYKEFVNSIIEQAKAEGKPAFIVGMGKTLKEPEYEFPIDGDGDVCIYVLARNSGEGADRTVKEGDFLLTASEKRDILICAEKYRKFMLVLNVGGVVDISPVVDKVENILVLSQLGIVTGDALADVLLGKAYPSGKLTTTWAKAEDYSKIGDFGEPDDTRYREGIFVGYRYFDAAQIKPAFPFGYGLGYTEFSIKPGNYKVENGELHVDVTVKNTGNFPGKEVVQLYYSAPEGRLKKPLRELGAFLKTKELKPGKSQTLTLTLPVENMASWDEKNACWILEKGDYLISIGTEPVCAVVLNNDVVTAKLEHVGGRPDFEDWKPDFKREIQDNIPRIIPDTIHMGHFDRNKISAEKLQMPDLSAFSDKELAYACVGKFLEDQGLASVIGNSSYSVAGAAGETADVIKNKRLR